MTPKIKDRWINAGISILAAVVIVVLTSFIGKGDARNNKINNKADLSYVDSQDEKIITQFKEADAAIEKEMDEVEARFNKGDERILDQMREDKRELLMAIENN
jgi:hypothetical protein